MFSNKKSQQDKIMNFLKSNILQITEIYRIVNNNDN